MMKRSLHARLWALVVAVIAVVALGGCSLNPGELASSVRSAGDGEVITVQFADTLNLPEGSDVTFNGTKVGSVTRVTLRGDHVDVDAKLTGNVRIPVKVTASIRQNTVLGDPYVALAATTGAADFLEAGGVVPLSQTTSPPPLEDTLAVVSTFVNGGSVQNMQDVIRTMNTALPDAGQTKRVAKISAIDLKSLSRGTDLLDGMIHGLDATSRAVIPHLPAIEAMLSDEGMHYWSQLSKLFSGIGIVLPSIGSVFEGGYWLMPLLRGVDANVATVRQGIDAVGSNQVVLQKFLSENLFPFIRKPGLEIVSATTPAGREVIGDVTKVLRMLGAVR
ncbi:MlaD family protein [Gordonia westfalica]|uniref:MlaD family protein n=1 Tax=Gordonia westfalica TaxID=158898 RepID=A0ABU2GTN1_9ACTN|nr:MlaD family protein [Gordonia westfalica]MDS1114808.1 MlaD family protein [Gordonia westfalica]